MTNHGDLSENQTVRVEDLPDTTVYHVESGGNGSIIDIQDFNLWYGYKKALHSIGLSIERGLVTSLIGPSGCGKSTLIRSINRMNDLIPVVATSGIIKVDDKNVYDADVDVTELRRGIGMVFQKPNPFPKSIAENIMYPLKLAGITDKKVLEETVVTSLQGAGLWNEVKDRLNQSAIGLSGGQQQRLCIARAIASQPEILLMDEPCSALDPMSTQTIEQLIEEMRRKYTIVIVTHNMQQAARVSDNTAFMYLGKLIEYGSTEVVFTKPMVSYTEDYVTGRFG